MRRYLKEVSRGARASAGPHAGRGRSDGGCKLGDLPRKIELRRTQAYAILAARRLFEPMKGSTLFDEIEMATERLLALAQTPGRRPNAGLADARLEQRFPLLCRSLPRTTAPRPKSWTTSSKRWPILRPLTLSLPQRPGRDAEETIVIHPYAMVLYKDAIYCLGLHTGKNEVRTFLLDRMRDTESSCARAIRAPPRFQGR